MLNHYRTTVIKRLTWIVLLPLLFSGCHQKERTEQAIADSIFGCYHYSESTFGPDEIQKLMDFSDSCGSRYGRNLALLDLASYHAVNSHHTEALHNLQQVDIKPNDPPFVLAYSDFVHGLVHQYNTNFGDALFFYKRAADGFEALHYQPALTATYTNMSEIYAEFEAWEMYEQYFAKAHISLQNTTMRAFRLASDSIYRLIHKGELEQALSAWHRLHNAYSTPLSSGKLQFAYTYNHYDQAQTIHYRQSDYDSAAFYNDILLNMVNESPQSAIYADRTLAKAKILAKQGACREALQLCLSLLDSENGTLPPTITIDIYPTLIDCYSQLHMTREMGQAVKDYSEKLHNNYIQTQRNNLLQVQIEQHYEQLLEQSREERQQFHNRALTIAIISLIIIMILMSIVIYKQHRQHVEQSLRLKSEQELDNTQHQLAESQMRQAKIQEQILTYTEQMRELATDMPKRLKARTFLNLDQIRQQRDADAWEDFEKAFQKKHGDFKKRLMEQYPNLNATDVKICILMRTQMPSKDVANMIHIKPETLRTFRYKLKIKLDIKDKGITLEEFINNF